MNVSATSAPQAPLFAPFSEAQKGLPTLGDLAWWSIPATVELPLPELEARLQAAGLPRELTPRVTPKGALSTALRALETESLIRRVLEDPEKVVYALVSEQVDPAKLALDYEQRETVVYRKATKSLEFANGEHAGKIRELFDRYRSTLTANHLRALVKNALDATDPVTVRPGLYFVPRRGRDRLVAVGGFVAKLGPGAALGTLGVVDSAETRATMLRVVREELERELETAGAELDELLGDPGVRTSTLVQRLEGFRRVKAKAQGYAELLSFSAQDLVRRVGELEEKVRQAV